MLTEYDPLHHFLGQYSPKFMVQMCKVIKSWAFAVEEGLYEDMYELINGHYQGGVYESKGGEVLENGIYKYPEDPDLYPVCKITAVNEIYFFYEYDFLAIRDKETNDTHLYRVD